MRRRARRQRARIRASPPQSKVPATKKKRCRSQRLLKCFLGGRLPEGRPPSASVLAQYPADARQFHGEETGHQRCAVSTQLPSPIACVSVSFPATDVSSLRGGFR